jgi:hypothetical protein
MEAGRAHLVGGGGTRDTGKYQKILKYPRFDDDLAAALEDVGDQSILVIAVLCFLTERNVQRVPLNQASVTCNASALGRPDRYR